MYFVSNLDSVVLQLIIYLKGKDMSKIELTNDEAYELGYRDGLHAGAYYEIKECGERVLVTGCLPRPLKLFIKMKKSNCKFILPSKRT